MSALVGAIAYLRFPNFLKKLLFSWFINTFEVNEDESEHPPLSYPSLGDFFTRNLKPSCRPIEDGALSPVDGRLDQFGRVENGTMLQVKGRSYQLSNLLRCDELTNYFQNGYYLTFYLAPGDYHHIHTPVSGVIKRALHIEGSLWPVDDWGLNRIDHLFARNERVVNVIETSQGLVSVIMVGATNVGSIVTEYAPFKANTNLGFCSKRNTVHRLSRRS